MADVVEGGHPKRGEVVEALHEAAVAFRGGGSRAGEALVLCGLAFVPLTWLAAAARAYARDRDAALDDLERFSIRDAGVGWRDTTRG